MVEFLSHLARLVWETRVTKRPVPSLRRRPSSFRVVQTEMTPLRLGIVGAGSIVAKKHLLALAEVPEIAVVGLCRRDAGELQVLADRFRVPRRYTDYRDLLSDPGIDAVLVATGPAAQPEIVIAAAAAGKHVFAEKPMADDGGRGARAGRRASATRRCTSRSASTSDSILATEPRGP